MDILSPKNWLVNVNITKSISIARVAKYIVLNAILFVRWFVDESKILDKELTKCRLVSFS